MPQPLPARFRPYVQGLVLTCLMTFVVSGISTLLALGLTWAFVARWPIAWGISWAIAFPTILFVMPLVQRIVARVVAPP